MFKTLDELVNYHDPDGFLDRQEQYKTSIGFLAMMSGILPHEIFEKSNWPKTIMFDLEVSQLTWKKYFEMMGKGVN